MRKNNRIGFIPIRLGDDVVLLLVSGLTAGAAGAAGLENKRFTVGALGYGGVHFMCAYHDLVKRAEVFTFGMMCTLLNGALNALICMGIHCVILLWKGCKVGTVLSEFSNI